MQNMDISGVTDGTVCCYDVVNSSFLSAIPIRKRYLSDLVNATYISDVEPRRLWDFIFSSFFFRPFFYSLQKKYVRIGN